MGRFVSYKFPHDPELGWIRVIIGKLWKGETMPAKDLRLSVPALSERHADLLAVAAALTGNSEPVEAKTLLQSALDRIETDLIKNIEYLAWKRQVPFAELWKDVASGDFKPLTKAEWNELPSPETAWFDVSE